MLCGVYKVVTLHWRLILSDSRIISLPVASGFRGVGLEPCPKTFARNSMNLKKKMSAEALLPRRHNFELDLVRSSPCCDDSSVSTTCSSTTIQKSNRSAKMTPPPHFYRGVAGSSTYRCYSSTVGKSICCFDACPRKGSRWHTMD
jgi:hypothetical protein